MLIFFIGFVTGMIVMTFVLSLCKVAGDDR